MGSRPKIEKHYVATPADPARPNGPRVWATLDISHPVEKMFRRGSLADNEATAFARYRAAQVWYRFFLVANNLSGYSPMLGEIVDGSGSPGAGTEAMMDAVRERLYTLDMKPMTRLRFDDLDSVVGCGMTCTERGARNGRAPNTVKESLFRGLDAVAGFRRWDRYLQAVQVVQSYPARDERSKKTGRAA